MTQRKYEGRAKGGKAVAENMTPEERKEKAMAMVEAKRARKLMPKVTHEGTLKIMEYEIPCYVLSDGKRVLSRRGISNVFTGNTGGGVMPSDSGAQKIPRFLAKKDIKSFINNELMARINDPVEFLPKAGRSAFGYDAALLPEICEVIIDAGRENGNINEMQYKVADILIRGFARVGITALVDEATGYQDDRAKNELSKILEAFVAKELQPWIKTFPISYYKELCRLYGVPFPPEKSNRFPQFFGHITNKAVYSRLAPELLPELKREAGKLKKKAALHQFLTSNVGHPKLREHLSSIITLLKLSKTKEDFFDMVDKVHPKFNENYTLDFDDI